MEARLSWALGLVLGDQGKASIEIGITFVVRGKYRLWLGSLGPR